MVEVVSKEKQQEILKHIRKHGCKVWLCPPKEGLTQAHIRVCLERNLSADKTMLKASSFADIVKVQLPLVLASKGNGKERD